MRLRIKYNVMEGNFRYKKAGEAEAWLIGCEGYNENLVLIDDNGKIFTIQRDHAISGEWRT